MSIQSQMRRITVPEIRAHNDAKPIVCLTCYHAHTAKLLDRHVDLILVGDTLGMVIHGMETTLGVTVEMMILHGQAVMRGSQRALVVVDMPFGSYEESPEVAFHNASRIMKEAGCQAVKLEGGTRMAQTIRYLSQRGIPVIAHIGMTPQNVQVLGAKAVTEAGAFALVREAMAEPRAARITELVAIPTIGIGASPTCDGQVLVMEDMLGLNPNPPKFVREYAQLGPVIAAAVEAYARDVRERRFPGSENVYPMKKAQ